MPTWDEIQERRYNPLYLQRTDTATQTPTIDWVADLERPKYVTQDMLDEFGRRLAMKKYNIITDKVALDISEEEFMDIINES